MEDYRKPLTVWYNHIKRDLPWRETREPYPIWVSEVILQQTRVQQGLNYYKEFLRKFPDITSLAMAPEEEVLKVWQGLGYYSRARNMHHAAKTIQSEYKGQFPADYASIRKLKGIGDYTAAAIASISFGLPHAVVDGNVYRVLSRLFGISTPIDTSIGKQEFYIVAQLLLDKGNPGEFNQALMELGAILCSPIQPDCGVCPLANKCHAFANHTVSDFPVKSKMAKQKERYFNYLYIFDREGFILEKRGDQDIWGNMFQFPMIETPASASPGELMRGETWTQYFSKAKITIESVEAERLHFLTHQRLHIQFISIRMESGRLPQHWIRISFEDFIKYPIPKPVEKYLAEKGY